MKSRSERTSVARLAVLLQRSRLLSRHEVEALQLRWRDESTEPEDLTAFTRWLIENGYATAFQVSLLLHKQFDYFFLGPYKLLERIGRGRLGSVYRAVHRLGQPVALKVLPPSRALDTRVLARFQHEAELTRPLRHLHVVRTLDGGEQRGLHYLVMEYLEGETLQQVVDQQSKLSPVLAVEIIRQALLGLDYLHQQGLVHRNLEPANLLLQRTGDDTGTQLTVKILDMSLVRATTGIFAGHPSASRDEEALSLMAPRYRAPEMAEGTDSADIRADIYSLGCVLYFALTGRTPFDDPSPQGDSFRHPTDSPVPLRQLTPEVPEAIEQIVGVMLANDPALRYSSPSQAATALEDFLESTSTIPPAGEVEVHSRSVEVVAVNPAPPEPILTEVSVERIPAPSASDAFGVDLGVREEPREWAGSSASGHKLDTSHGRGMGSRDSKMLLLGGIGLLLAELLGWLLTLLLDMAKP